MPAGPRRTGITRSRPGTPSAHGQPRAFTHQLHPVVSGGLVEYFGCERDDVPARFFLRDLAPAELPPQGLWQRYDLGRVRLMRSRFVISVSWEKSGGELHYSLQTPAPLTLRLPANLGGATVRVDGTYSATWPVEACR